jgi:sortase B
LFSQQDLQENIMGRKTRKALIIILSLVLLGSLGAVGYEIAEYKQGSDSYEKAEELSGLPDLSDIETEAASASDTGETTSTDIQGTGAQTWSDPYADALGKMDFTALRKVNPDVLGWIYVPGTVISYPVVYSNQKDSTYYLKHTWSGDYGIVGAIFVEPANSSSLSNFNTVIYGHNMNNGSMFGSLKSFRSQSYWSSHRNIYITSDGGARCYQIFAAYEVSTSGDAYQIGFSSDNAKQAFIDSCLKHSAISTGVTPTVNDTILTLSTCTGHGHATRWVVQAVLKNAAPAVKPSPSPSPSALPAPTESEQPADAAPTETPAAEQTPSAETPVTSDAPTEGQ